MKRERVPASVLGAVLLVGALLAAHAVAEEEITWVTAEGSASMDQASKDDARNLAREDALRKARAQVAGSSVSAESLAVNLKLSGGLIAAIPYVRVVDTSVLEEGVVSAATAGNAAGARMYRFLVKTGIVEETEGGDPAFTMEASLNRTSFLDGEEMKIRMKSTKDCYVAVFIIMEDGKVLRLLPNRFKKTIFLKAGEPFSFPDETDKGKGMKLVVHAADSKPASESIYILALKQPFSYDASRFQEGIYGVYDGNTAFMNDLVQEIAGIPLKDRAEKFLQYQIRKQKEKGGAR